MQDLPCINHAGLESSQHKALFPFWEAKMPPLLFSISLA